MARRAANLTPWLATVLLAIPGHAAAQFKIENGEIRRIEMIGPSVPYS